MKKFYNRQIEVQNHPHAQVMAEVFEPSQHVDLPPGVRAYACCDGSGEVLYIHDGSMIIEPGHYVVVRYVNEGNSCIILNRSMFVEKYEHYDPEKHGHTWYSDFMKPGDKYPEEVVAIIRGDRNGQKDIKMKPYLE